MSAAVVADAAAAATRSQCNSSNGSSSMSGNSVSNQQLSPPPPPPLSRYESQKRRDWNTFTQYLKNHRPPLVLYRCSGAHVLEFLRYLDQFGKTKVHTSTCPFFGHTHPPAPCPCPLRQAWGSLDALIGRLRAAFEENGGQSETNPFGARAVRLYLREVRDTQAKARGVAYEKKKRKKPEQQRSSQMILGQLQSSSCDVNSSKDVHLAEHGLLDHSYSSEPNEAVVMAGSLIPLVGAGDVAVGAVPGDFPEQLVLREHELGLDVEDFSPLVDCFPDLIQLVAPKMAVAEMRFGMEFWWKKF
ncbi:hypothetical protein F0562_029560 [Nyssa sinensis]|uniref:ALOG domain-containing protein n=1 Tax=Nyssa sinensis TaxID=561372 RepID=A0A5J5B5J9_9ASTE|nr:hypothetical protein F0562_029560 [Nyssa sinensis]